jgi:hypothetical protein
MQSQDNEGSRKDSAGVMAQVSGDEDWDVGPGKAKAATAKQDKGARPSKHKRKVCS